VRPQGEEKAPHAIVGDRDRDIEARYRYDADGYTSALAFVSAHAPALVLEFWSWRRENAGGSVLDAVQRWESARFGAQLYPAASGVMWWYIRQSLKPGDRPQSTPPPARPTLTTQQRLDAFVGAVETRAEAARFPGMEG
jgi:hypothetical protein